MSAAVVLCRCGCGFPAPIAAETNRRRGVIKGEPLAFRRGHNARKPVNRYVVDERTGCWNWAGGKTLLGYGLLQPRVGKITLAHRFFYEKAEGSIPTGLELDHLCRNTRCVNPDHLEAVSHAENCRRGSQAKTDPETAREIRSLRTKGVTVGELAERFGIAPRTVYGITRGENWA